MVRISSFQFLSKYDIQRKELFFSFINNNKSNRRRKKERRGEDVGAWRNFPGFFIRRNWWIIMGLWGEIKPVSRIKGGLGSSRNVLCIIYFFIRTTFNRRSTNSEFNMDYTYIHTFFYFEIWPGTMTELTLRLWKKKKIMLNPNSFQKIC